MSDTQQRTLLDKADEFCNRVLHACRDTTTRARIRTALGVEPVNATRAHQPMARLVQPGIREESETVYYTMAALLAAHDNYGSWDRPKHRRNIGGSVAELVDRNLLAGTSGSNQMEQLSRASLPDLMYHYRRIATIAVPKSVWCDWGMWLRDGLLWSKHQPSLTRDWAYTFARRTAPPVTDFDQENTQP